MARPSLIPPNLVLPLLQKWEAGMKGEQLAEMYHEQKLHAGADGEIDGFNASARIFIMKSRYRETYGEQKEEKSAGDTLLEQLALGKLKVISNE